MSSSAVSKCKTKRSILREVNRHKAAIAKHRDALRDLIEDAEAVSESCDDAVRSLESAADALSQNL